jgi:hypothetical protein
LRLSLRLPLIVMGIPIDEVVNPYLVVPGEQVKFELKYQENCEGADLSAEGLPQEVVGKAREFWRRLMSGLNMSDCSYVKPEGLPQRRPAASVYAALTTALLYLTARSHSDTMDELEIVEMGRMSDPWGEGATWWQSSIDAMRYVAASGKAAAYRSEDEVVDLQLGRVDLNMEVRASSVVGRGATRQELGESLFDAAVHMIGQAVVDLSDSLTSGSPLRGELVKRLRVQNAAAYLFYGVQTPQGECEWVPGLPGELELVCLTA